MHNVTINISLYGAFSADTINSRVTPMTKQANKTVDEIDRQRLKTIASGHFS